jgi:hypothetical protein
MIHARVEVEKNINIAVARINNRQGALLWISPV